MSKFVPVTFRIYSVYSQGKDKGKPVKASFHTLTLYRELDVESVGQTLKRVKEMISEGTRITILNPGIESDNERLARYAAKGLEVVTEAPSAVVKTSKEQPISMSMVLTKADMQAQAGDVTMVA